VSFSFWQDWRVSVALAVVFWGLWGLFSKIAVTRLGWPTSLVLGWLAGVAAVAPFVVGDFRWQAFNVSWPAFAYGACGAAGALFLLKALEQGPATVVLPVSEGWLVVAVLLSVAFLGESLNPRRLAGLALVLAGAALLAKE
jgi:transporter family protein